MEIFDVSVGEVHRGHHGACLLGEPVHDGAGRGWYVARQEACDLQVCRGVQPVLYGRGEGLHPP